MFYYLVYKTTNLINKKFYYGVHKTKNLNDGYLGSGKILGQAIEKYGKENFHREIIEFCKSYEEALDIEKVLVTEDLVSSCNCYNITLGGGMPPRQSKENHWAWGIKRHDSSERMKKDNPSRREDVREKARNTVIVEDKDSNKFRIKKDDPRYLSGELKHINKGKVTVVDTDGNKISIKTDDPRYLSGELVQHTKGTFLAKDRDGNHLRIKSDDPRVISGEIVAASKGRSIPWSEERKQNYKENPRSSWNKGIKTGKRSPEVGRKISEKNKGRTKPTITCPHCNKTGGKPAMMRFHFDKCKEIK